MYLLAIYMFFWEENIYSGLLPIFDQIFFFDIEVFELFIYFGY